MADQGWTQRLQGRARNPFGGNVASKMSGFNARMQQSSIGRAFMGGSAEALGFYTPGFRDEQIGSFLGLRETFGEVGGRRGEAFQRLIKQGRYGNAARFAAGRARRIGGKASLGFAAKFAGSTLMKSIPIVSTVAMAYSGYQGNGMVGAVEGIAESMLTNAGIRQAATLLSNPVTLTLAGIAAAGAATYALGEAGRAHAQGLRNLEMGGPQIQEALSSAGAATMRQRSMMALNNTHLNGRMAMGNEAALMHDGAASIGLGGRF